MSALICIDYLPGLLRAARLEDDRLEDILILRDDRPVYVGNKYDGRLVSLDRGLDAAFVDIGLSQPGFLPMGEVARSLKAEKGLSEGDYLRVEVTREGADGKGVRLRARGDAVPSGKKVSLVQACDPLADWLRRQEVLPEEILVTDAGVLRRLRLLFADPEAGFPVDEITNCDLSLQADKPNLFEAMGLEEALENLLQVDVPLSSGGSLIIEQGRSLTAVDVNKGSMQHNGGNEMLHLLLCQEASVEIARQLRLRNIAGRILIDFPHLKAPESRKKLQACLKGELKRDPVGHKLFPLYLSGLQELTRKRAGRSLQELLLRPVGIGGLGHEPDASAVAYAALRRLWCSCVRGGQKGHGEISGASRGPELVVAADVAEILEKSAARSYVEDRIGWKIRIESHPAQVEGFTVNI
ncbi:ribonuclease E/G [Kiloniella laminariae]|uniref:Ribonuclease E/G n=1 Tax=Kiloniella laminariae TaxID=454162 RepID=A0ABT4LG44_9PROT|nr:ribonuclease E/G [Kiloniella laminariae]MCZ4280067.1 ribonuclease E/G [Kiloniella laminariae]